MNKLKVNKETLLYIVIWTLLFISPVVSSYFHTYADGEMFRWSEIMRIWRVFTIYLVIFLAHNFILAPLLIYKHKHALYLSVTLMVVFLFGFFQCANRPSISEKTPEHKEIPVPSRPKKRPLPPPHDNGKMMRHEPPAVIGQMDVISVLILIGLIGLNLGIKLYFKNERDQREYALLERKNLNQQLQYLKYQINPHFFMNTLNNIHALVDIDPKRAKTAIVELSKMMRYVLYEGDKALIPLSNEVVFLENYVQLMMLRYTDNVSVDLDIPENLPAGNIPPLLLITFVENAFKHGVSYEHESFVNISMDIEKGNLLFSCVNSRRQNDEDKMPHEGGVGLKNVRQRLNLIYHDSYRLDIEESEDTYKVKLSLPLRDIQKISW